MGVLTVYLDKITNLADTDVIGKADPYVKFQLEQDNWVLDKGFGHKRSTKKNGELNPVYGETFEFEGVPSCDNMVLHCKVMDDDPLFDDKMGSCKIKLEELDLSETPTGVDRVIDNHIFSKDGKIYLQLSFKAD